MNQAIILLAILIFILLISNLKVKFKKGQTQPSLINRFRKRVQSKNHLKEKVSNKYSDALMTNPEGNIIFSFWEGEYELREKADIHRARLNRYGRSKVNGEMLFLASKGRVFKYTSDGEKKYL